MIQSHVCISKHLIRSFLWYILSSMDLLMIIQIIWHPILCSWITSFKSYYIWLLVINSLLVILLKIELGFPCFLLIHVFFIFPYTCFKTHLYMLHLRCIWAYYWWEQGWCLSMDHQAQGHGVLAYAYGGEEI